MNSIEYYLNDSCALIILRNIMIAIELGLMMSCLKNECICIVDDLVKMSLEI